MYIPKQFSSDELTRCFMLIEQNPLGVIISNDNGELDSNLVPLLLLKEASNGVLIGHVAKANPLWQTLEKIGSALIVFQGEDHYISPNFYASKADNPKVVPTWNYSTVQVKAGVTVQHDAQWKLNMLERLTNYHEARQDEPWSISDAPSSFIEKQMAGIVGVEFEIISMVGKWKLSQNQPQENQESVINALKKSEHGQQLAKEMTDVKKQ